MKTFWQFVEERMTIHDKRAAGFPKPWTDDVVLRDNFFTNCFRELDPGTHVARDIVQMKRPAWERLWNLILYRRLNREETWRAIGGYGPPRPIERLLRTIDGPVFTGAHQVNMLQMRVEGRDAINRQAVMMTMLTEKRLGVLAHYLKRARTARDAYGAWLAAELPGVGAFLAWQLALDSNYGLADFSEDEWAPVQAGAMAGLKIVLGVTPSGKRNAEDMLVDLRHSPKNTRGLTVAAVEHSLCEYSKYHRIALGGHSKGKFDGKKGE